MPFTPGLSFLAQSLFLPVALPGTLILLLHHFDLLQIPTYHLFALFVASFPAYISFRIIKQDIQHARHAKSLGARLVPKLKGKLPGNLDILRKLMHAERYGYPGAFTFFLGCYNDFLWGGRWPYGGCVQGLRCYGQLQASMGEYHLHDRSPCNQGTRKKYLHLQLHLGWHFRFILDNSC